MATDLDGPASVRLAQRAKVCAKKALAKGRAAAKEWAAVARSQGAKLAHRWTGRIGTKPQLAEEVISGSEHFCTPVDMVGSKVAEDTRLYPRHSEGNPGSQEMCEGKSGLAQDRAQGLG